MKKLLLILLFIPIIGIGQINIPIDTSVVQRTYNRGKITDSLISGFLTINLDEISEIKKDTSKVMIIRPKNIELFDRWNGGQTNTFSINVLTFEIVYCVTIDTIYRYRYLRSTDEYYSLKWEKIYIGGYPLLTFSPIENIKIDTIRLQRNGSMLHREIIKYFENN